MTRWSASKLSEYVDATGFFGSRGCEEFEFPHIFAQFESFTGAFGGFLYGCIEIKSDGGAVEINSGTVIQPAASWIAL